MIHLASNQLQSQREHPIVSEGGLLEQKTAERMATPVMGGCGLCLFRDGGTAYHYGANAGFLTFWRFSLKGDLCVAGMVNNSDRRTFKAMQEIEKQLLGRL